MLKHREFWILTGAAALAAVLVFTNMVLFTVNRSTQADIQKRAQFVQQTAQLEVLYREIVKALADLSIKNQDAQLRSMLAAHGISVTVNAPPQDAAAGAQTGQRSGRR